MRPLTCIYILLFTTIIGSMPNLTSGVGQSVQLREDDITTARDESAAQQSLEYPAEIFARSTQGLQSRRSFDWDWETFEESTLF
jgi:hypothetical protein